MNIYGANQCRRCTRYSFEVSIVSPHTLDLSCSCVAGRNYSANSKRWRAKQGADYRRREVKRVSKHYVPQGEKTIEEREKARARARESMAKTRAKRKAEQISLDRTKETVKETEVQSVFVNVCVTVFR